VSIAMYIHVKLRITFLTAKLEECDAPFLPDVNAHPQLQHLPQQS